MKTEQEIKLRSTSVVGLESKQLEANPEVLITFTNLYVFFMDSLQDQKSNFQIDHNDKRLEEDVAQQLIDNFSD